MIRRARTRTRGAAWRSVAQLGAAVSSAPQLRRPPRAPEGAFEGGEGAFVEQGVQGGEGPDALEDGLGEVLRGRESVRGHEGDEGEERGMGASFGAWQRVGVVRVSEGGAARLGFGRGLDLFTVPSGGVDPVAVKHLQIREIWPGKERKISYPKNQTEASIVRKHVMLSLLCGSEEGMKESPEVSLQRPGSLHASRRVTPQKKGAVAQRG